MAEMFRTKLLQFLARKKKQIHCVNSPQGDATHAASGLTSCQSQKSTKRLLSFYFNRSNTANHQTAKKLMTKQRPKSIATTCCNMHPCSPRSNNSCCEPSNLLLDVGDEKNVPFRNISFEARLPKFKVAKKLRTKLHETTQQPMLRAAMHSHS